MNKRINHSVFNGHFKLMERELSLRITFTSGKISHSGELKYFQISYYCSVNIS